MRMALTAELLRDPRSDDAEPAPIRVQEAGPASAEATQPCELSIPRGERALAVRFVSA